CKTVISEGVDVQLTASCHKPWRRSKSCQPREDAAPNSHRAWCARRKDVTSVGLGTATLDDRCGDARPRGHGPQTLGEGLHIHPLQRLKVWFTYKDGNHLDTKMNELYVLLQKCCEVNECSTWEKRRGYFY
ncbi:hypothetical protein O3P69_018941, partial [Scylla paramamosain]